MYVCSKKSLTMWNDEQPMLRSMGSPPDDLLAEKAPFSDLPLSKTLLKDTSPFCSLFTDEMLRESNLTMIATEDDDTIEEKPTTELFDEAEENNADEQVSSASIATQPQQFICQHCHFATPHRKTFMVHKRTHAGVKSFSCEMCSAKFTRSYSLKKHLTQKHSPHSTTSSMPKYCPFPSCSYVTRSTNALQVHRRAHHTSLYYCKQCNVKYSLRRSLLHHLTLHHGSNADFFGVRALQDDSSQNTIDDKKVETAEASQPASDDVQSFGYRCDKCDFSVATLRDLYLHKRFKHVTKKKAKSNTTSRRRAKAVTCAKAPSRPHSVEVDSTPAHYQDANEDSSIQTLNNGVQLSISPCTSDELSTSVRNVVEVPWMNSKGKVSGSPQSPKCNGLPKEPSILDGTLWTDESSEYNELSRLTDCIICLQESNAIISELYKRKMSELDSLRQLATEFVRRVMPTHPIVRDMHTWRNIDSVLQHFLNGNHQF